MFRQRMTEGDRMQKVIRAAVLMACLGFAACGGGDGGASDALDADEAFKATEPAGELAEAASGEAVQSKASPNAMEEAPSRTITAAQLPDPCKLLTAEDAAELLGEPVGPGESPDAGGRPCVYRGKDGKSDIVLDMSLAPDSSINRTQLKVSLAYCEGEAVVEPKDLGRQAAFFHMKKENCGSDTLWVSTGVYFQGTEASVYTGRTPAGWIHFTFGMSPQPDQAALIEKLTTAARRALDRLPE
jgi:hypothetical protein